MPPAPLRGPTRKASSSLPVVQRANFLLDASQYYRDLSPQLSAVLGREALRVSAGERSFLPRGALTSMCTKCGLPFDAQAYIGAETVPLPHNAKRSRRRRPNSGPSANIVNRAMTICTCPACEHKLKRKFPSVQQALDAHKKICGQQQTQKPSSNIATKDDSRHTQ